MNEKDFTNPIIVTCKFCGSELSNNSRFCSSCGKSAVLQNESPPKKSLKGSASVVFMIISVVLTLVFFITSLHGKLSLSMLLLYSLICGFLTGGIIPGFLHFGAILTKTIEIAKALISNLIYIPVIGWVIIIVFCAYIPCFCIGIPCFAGWIFMLYDFIKFMKEYRQKNK
ncbi:MAG: hypothetical protein K2G63_04455 [Oscillospiraceae bacterium]|nr:hypothetical protein [Oscillospiraceae bacterium]